MLTTDTDPARTRPATDRPADALRERPAVLCVDDEPNVLEGLALHLERQYRVTTAGSGALALEQLERDGPPAVVISDMRMPGMDGATLLGQIRTRYPDTVRLLLTGHADIDSAVAAINEGQIFRFLGKPCPPPQLLAAVRAAVEQHRLVTSERVLLRDTLRGSIEALIDVLALTQPLAFGRATRIRKSVRELAGHVGMEECWQVEIAGMLSQIGSVTLAAGTIEKLHYGHELSDEEAAQVAALPAVAERLLANIPRLEAVRAIIAAYASERPRATRSDEQAHDPIRDGAAMLRIAADYDSLEARGMDLARALDTMRGREHRYDPELLEAFAELRGSAERNEVIEELPLRALKVGMVLVDDACMENGALLAARGYQITKSFVERARFFRPGTVREPLRVAVPWERA